MSKKSMKRSCTGCTACCDGWVQMVIDGQAVFPGHPCPHSTGRGCAIYATRPTEPCRNFFCGWILENSPLPDWLHPERAKVLVIFDKFRWNGVPVDIAVPVGKRIPPRSLRWLQNFAQQHGRPLLFAKQVIENDEMQAQQDFLGFGPPAFQDYVRSRQEQGLPLW